MQHDGWLETSLQPLPEAESGHPRSRLFRRRSGRLHRQARLQPAAPLRQLRQPRRVADAHQGRRGLRLLRLQRIVRRQGRPRQVQAGSRTTSSSTRWRRSTTASRRRAWCSSRRSPMRTCTTATCPTAPRTTSAWPCTPTAMARSPRPTKSRSSISLSRRRLSTRKAAKPLTINGIHLNAAGRRPHRPGHRPGAVRRPIPT